MLHFSLGPSRAIHFLTLPWPGWGANPGSLVFFVYFLITLPLSHSGSPITYDNICIVSTFIFSNAHNGNGD
jgi:hypothetical protein